MKAAQAFLLLESSTRPHGELGFYIKSCYLFQIRLSRAAKVKEATQSLSFLLPHFWLQPGAPGQGGEEKSVKQNPYPEPSKEVF